MCTMLPTIKACKFQCNMPGGHQPHFSPDLATLSASTRGYPATLISVAKCWVISNTDHMPWTIISYNQQYLVQGEGASCRLWQSAPITHPHHCSHHYIAKSLIDFPEFSEPDPVFPMCLLSLLLPSCTSVLRAPLGLVGTAPVCWERQGWHVTCRLSGTQLS